MVDQLTRYHGYLHHPLIHAKLNIFNSSEPETIVLTGSTNLDPIWIGMQLVQSRYFVWSDKSDVTLTNWKFNHPDYFLVGGTRESCVAMEESVSARSN